MRKITLFILVLAALVGIAGYYYYQKNIYSKEVLKLEILGPAETEFLEEFDYIVKYKNNGDVRLEEPRLIFEYPQNSLVEEGKSQREEMTLEDIYPGQEETIHFKARLLGKEGDTFLAKAWLSYRPRNLKARYESATTLTTVINKVPLTFDFDLTSKIESGKDFNFKINYFSNTDYFLSDLRIQIDYPSGFEFISANPKSIEKNEWEIPILNKSEGGRIEVSGKLSGEVGEAKLFGARLGIWKEDNFILLKEIKKGVEIVEPSLYLRQEINGNPQYVALPGDWLHYEIYFKNIGNDALNDLYMICQLEGEAFDFQTIKSDSGSSQSGDNSIIFDWRMVSKLQYLFPMDEGKVDFWIKLKEELGDVKNPTLKNKIFISQVKQEFVTKIGSKLEIVQQGYFYDEVFGNTGPLPPTVGQTTTYTIIWRVKNYYSDVKDVKARALLPKNILLTGKIFPEEETSKFAYDSQSREIVWSVGDLEKGKGISEPGASIAFQISFIPDSSQKGQTPDLISEAKIEAEDAWTETTISATSSALNTTLPSDPMINEGLGMVK